MLPISKAIMTVHNDSGDLFDRIGDNMFNTRAPNHTDDNYVVFSFVTGSPAYLTNNGELEVLTQQIVQFSIYAADNRNTDAVAEAMAISRDLMQAYDGVDLEFPDGEYKSGTMMRQTEPRVIDSQDEISISMDYMVYAHRA